jgi:hypothetical protein
MSNNLYQPKKIKYIHFQIQINPTNNHDLISFNFS